MAGIDSVLLKALQKQGKKLTTANMSQYQGRNHNKQYGGKNKRNESQMRVTEVMARRLQEAIDLSDKKANGDGKKHTNTLRRMEGDISQLELHKSFFMQGVRIGWPYPIIMKPQRQMALHLIQALKRKLHVVLESPTGTGKSHAILCSVLAWQRYHAKISSSGEEPPPRIIYCSRTHSQVAQMVASLKKTPYRPRMTVLGSRERLCIHREIKPRDGSRPSKRGPINVNSECQSRVKQTEKARQTIDKYDDESPPIHLDGDGVGVALDDKNPNKITCLCPHYRQLTTTGFASKVQAKFAPNQAIVNSCAAGGAKTKLGAMDIEDLVEFGMNPNVERGIALYRDGGTGSFGMNLIENKSKKGCITINSVQAGGAAAKDGSVRARDRILKVNGKDMRNQSVDTVVVECRNTKDPLDLDILREGGLFTDGMDCDDMLYSPHSACPYYTSRGLLKHAELVFAPYNYILEPGIRKAMDIDLSGAVVVLDEAHNVEDTLREGGSFNFPEFELCEFVSVLSYHAAQKKTGKNMTDYYTGKEYDFELCEAAHQLLLFCEQIVLLMRESRGQFEQNPGNNGAAAKIRDYQRYHTPDDKEFEVTYYGPTGYGLNGKPVGCKPFFDKFRTTSGDKLVEYASAVESQLGGDKQTESSGGRSTALLDRLVEFVTKFSFAMKSPEHFYVACNVHANGSLDFAAGGQSRKKAPKTVPFVYPRNSQHPRVSLPACRHEPCKSMQVYHGDFCDGSKPLWEASLKLELLTPSMLMREVADQCRTVVLASGSLAPLPSLCAELGLSTPVASDKTPHIQATPSSPLIPKVQAGRLQLQPKPLEADHVIDLEKQLRAVSIGAFPDGSPLSVTFQNYSKKEFFPRLGHAIAAVIEAIPQGGVLVFLPSYSFLKNCVKSWNPTANTWSRYGDDGVDGEIWERFLSSKGKVVVEPTGSQGAFEKAKAEYTDSIHRDGKALLLAVFRGKMSEGISFNDDNARGVICVGLPFPNAYDRSIKAKKAYNDEQRKLRHSTCLLPGGQWYTQQAYRAIAQALGRCIRHAGDYGTVVLMDSRHCDDGAPTDGIICPQHRNLPNWMRTSVRNLSMSTNSRIPVNGNAPIYGGYSGLADEYREFFITAREHSQAVLEKFKKDFEAAQAPERQIHHSFNTKTGQWTC